jgi:hypothetical protein
MRLDGWDVSFWCRSTMELECLSATPRNDCNALPLQGDRLLTLLFPQQISDYCRGTTSQPAFLLPPTPHTPQSRTNKLRHVRRGAAVQAGGRSPAHWHLLCRRSSDRTPFGKWLSNLSWPLSRDTCKTRLGRCGEGTLRGQLEAESGESQTQRRERPCFPQSARR